MSARSRALDPLSAEQQAAMQAVAVTEQRRRRDAHFQHGLMPPLSFAA